MTSLNKPNPFHAGERAAQARAGVGDVARWAGGFIRDALPEQHRAFHTALPFLVLSGADAQGQVWTTLVEGDDGFITSPDPTHLVLDTAISKQDPLADRFTEGGDIGGLGIELATRRRNRFSAEIQPGGSAVALRMRQTFGNCPQYIHPRGLQRVAPAKEVTAQRTSELTEDQITLIKGADTLFIGSGHQGAAGARSNGYDASHRGGAPGFAHVASPRRLLIPDYAGNNFFNTIGNLMTDPRIGLLLVDFASGRLLHLSGRAKIDWSPEGAHDPDAWRMIEVEIDAVIDRQAALRLRWQRLDDRARKLRLVERVKEAEQISSFYFTPVDGQPLDPARPGQHLPIAVQIPGQGGPTKRSYSLSGRAMDRSQYRLSIKREEQGLMSRFLHDTLRPGDVIEAMPPEGSFGIPKGTGPVILISAGVGLTPMLPILHALAGKERRACSLHAARNGRESALASEVNALVAQHANVSKCLFFSRPAPGDQRGIDFDRAGHITAAEVIAAAEGLGRLSEAQFLMCGPRPFLSDIKAGLEAQGVPSDHIHFETFGPSAQGAKKAE
ncbi:FAD-binding oxidoreductase [Cognatishimia sp. SS12]|uniref:FAD-binding oxidoreductase n=1 Tax=Cognatishimia sp. SS12 TaxID=2979465 RepID=UPI00232D1C71|nr:pyridoxamine 5'-phosphate oxidase family protein [Cognatishimia sp. SS12]